MSKTLSNEFNLFIDLGTAHTVIVVKDHGIVLNEPSIIAIQELGPQRHKVLAAGRQAVELVKKNPGNIYLRYPLRDGVVADTQNTAQMLRIFFQNLPSRIRPYIPKALVVVPFEASEVERKGTLHILKAAGINKARLIDEPLVGAIGAELPIHKPQGFMVVDFGGGTVEVAVIALNDIIYCESLKLGGHRMVDAIIDHYKNQHNLLIDRENAERIKIQYATSIPRKNVVAFSLEGVDSRSGVPKTITTNSEELSLILHPFFDQITQAIFRALSQTPPELVSDIMDGQLVLIGGGALTKEIAERITNDTQIKARIAADPLLCMAKGGHRLLLNPEILNELSWEE
ncbi:MAG: rod shape-determining protein [Pseudobdellovibrionaceae bacterium]|nr:rod shape-determining protein [Pseudobdellovibrionaceae bacterium]